MSGGPWVAWLMLAVAPLMVLYVRVRYSRKVWDRIWATVWANTRTVAGWAVEWLQWRLAPAAVRLLRRIPTRLHRRQEAR